MTEISTNTRSATDLWNQILVTIGTHTELAAMPKTFAGMLVFATSTGGVFVQNKLYQRNAANDAWIEVIDFSSTQTITGKTLTGASNTYSSIPTASLVDGAITGAKFSEVLHATGSAVLSVSRSTTNTSYEDVANQSVTITAKGNRSGLMCEWFASVDIDSTNTVTIAITDGSDTVLSEFDMQRSNHHGECMNVWPSYEAAPAAGSLTRKVRWKVDAGTATANGGTLTNGLLMVVVEVI